RAEGAFSSPGARRRRPRGRGFGRGRGRRRSRRPPPTRARRRGGRPRSRAPFRAQPMRVTVAALRRYAVAHQGYAGRFRRATPDHVVAEVGRLQAVQLDSISVVDRAHRLTLAARIGAYEEAAVSELLRAGSLFEYWSHEACLLPIEDYPLFKRRMLEL